MRVLLADDSDLILERLQKMVSMFSQVEIVGLYKNGLETLEALRLLKPDLAIVDIKMPGISGLKVLKEIRKEDKTIKFMKKISSEEESVKTAPEVVSILEAEINK